MTAPLLGKYAPGAGRKPAPTPSPNALGCSAEEPEIGSLVLSETPSLSSIVSFSAVSRRRMAMDVNDFGAINCLCPTHR